MNVDDERKAFDNLPLGVTEELHNLLFERHLEKQLKSTTNHAKMSKTPSGKKRAAIRRDLLTIQYAKEDAAIEAAHL